MDSGLDLFGPRRWHNGQIEPKAQGAQASLYPAGVRSMCAGIQVRSALMLEPTARTWQTEQMAQ
jgi:hypothetical protein